MATYVGKQVRSEPAEFICFSHQKSTENVSVNVSVLRVHQERFLLHRGIDRHPLVWVSVILLSEQVVLVDLADLVRLRRESLQALFLVAQSDALPSHTCLLPVDGVLDVVFALRAELRHLVALAGLQLVSGCHQEVGIAVQLELAGL